MVATRYHDPRAESLKRAHCLPPANELGESWLTWNFSICRRNHYTRPLEEAISTHQSQWPKAWQGRNPLHGGRSFTTMAPEERVRSCKRGNATINSDIYFLIAGAASILDTLVLGIIGCDPGQDKGIIQAGAPR